MLPIHSEFIQFLSLPKRLHFAAHSHHPWPDVTFAAQQQAWRDAARHIDQKWDGVLFDVLPTAKAHIARVLNLPDANTIVTAPNTHELLLRLLSCVDRQPVRILTTDSEFHSFSRQVQRLEESSAVAVTRVPTAPFEDFKDRFIQASQKSAFDLIYISQVFFNSGYAIQDLEHLVGALPTAPLLAIDGYHGFMARPTDLAPIADRAFYLAGGYKYAMAGEGACFMHCPPGYGARPMNSGWYAGFGNLAGPQSSVQYTEDGNRFMGATFDPTPWYRFNAVQDLLRKLQIPVSDIHAHARRLQDHFLRGLNAQMPISSTQLVPPQPIPRGNFLTFATPKAEAVHKALAVQHVITDFRADRLRFGFGVYQQVSDVDELLRRLQKVSI